MATRSFRLWGKLFANRGMGGKSWGSLGILPNCLPNDSSNKIMRLTQEQPPPPKKAEGNFIWVQSGYFSPAFSRQSKTDLNLWWEEEGCREWSFINIFWCLHTREHPFTCRHLSFGSVAFCKNLISLTSSWSAARFCVDHLSSDYLFHPKSDSHVYSSWSWHLEQL